MSEESSKTTSLLFDMYLNEYKSNFEGWDFSYISERMREGNKSWSYETIVRSHLRITNSLLDIETGGGEFLSRLTVPDQTYATESYGPNIAIAKNRLEPLGISVEVPESDDKLPFDNEFFDLVICRHGFYDPSEINRIIKTGGIFITQQVGKDDNIKINQLLKSPMPEEYDPQWTVEFLGKQLIDENFEIVRLTSEKYQTRLFDIGALLYYLKAIPWQIPDFSPDSYIDQLRELHQKLSIEGYIDLDTERYLIIAKKQ